MTWRDLHIFLGMMTTALLVAGCGNVQRPPGPPLVDSKAFAPAASGAEPVASTPETPSALAAAMDRRLAEWRIDRLPLATVLARITAETGVAMEIRWDRLAKSDVKPESPVTARLYNVRATKCLQICLDSVAQHQRVRWWVASDDGPPRLIISSHEDYVQSCAVTVNYDISDLLVVAKDLTSVDELIALIRDVIDPMSWHEQEPDGFATISDAGHRLVVYQSKENHAKLRQLLASLRITLPKQRRINSALASGEIRRHLLSFPDAKFRQGEEATYVLDGVAIGKGDQGYAKLLVAIDGYPPGAILADTSNYETGIPMYWSPNDFRKFVPYEKHREELFSRIKSRRLRFECPLGSRVFPSLEEDNLPPFVPPRDSKGVDKQGDSDCY